MFVPIFFPEKSSLFFFRWHPWFYLHDGGTFSLNLHDDAFGFIDMTVHLPLTYCRCAFGKKTIEKMCVATWDLGNNCTGCFVFFLSFSLSVQLFTSF